MFNTTKLTYAFSRHLPKSGKGGPKRRPSGCWGRNPLYSKMLAGIPSGYKRMGGIGLLVATFLFINWYVFVKPARDVKKKFGGFGKVGYTKLNPGGQSRFKAGDFGFLNPDDPSHAGIPKLEYDPRAALSDGMLSEKFFFPGYNLTRMVKTYA